VQVERMMWIKLAVMTLLGFIAMYFLMYQMVNSSRDLILSVNQIWMAGSMAAAMVAIELLIMGEMYKNRAIRFGLIGLSTLMTVVFVLFTRYQTAIDNNDFLRSMIPHHSGAILMCSNPKLTDPEIVKLCGQITKSQQEEIDEMNQIRTRLDGE
jgi:uncharacterized protein (DUF305 family)